MHPAQASPSELVALSLSAATRRPLVRSPQKRRLTCPRVRTPPRPCPGAHLTRVGALSGPGTRPGIRPVIRHRWRRSQPCWSRFPAAFRPPAFAFRVILFPPGSWAFLTVGLPGASLAPGPGRGFHVPHCEIRPGWVPPRPRGRRCSPGRMPCPAVACRFPAASPCTPHLHPTSGATHHEASTRVHAIHPSGLSLACGLPDGTGNPWAFPCAPHPAVTGSARQGGAGLRARARNYAADIIGPPIREFTRKVRPRVATADEDVLGDRNVRSDVIGAAVLSAACARGPGDVDVITEANSAEHPVSRRA
jgi:hypothetical protein